MFGTDIFSQQFTRDDLICPACQRPIAIKCEVMVSMPEISRAATSRGNLTDDSFLASVKTKLKSVVIHHECKPGDEKEASNG